MKESQFLIPRAKSVENPESLRNDVSGDSNKFFNVSEVAVAVERVIEYIGSL